MYTLRLIDQDLNNSEVVTNVHLGKSYTVTMNVVNPNEKKENSFDLAVKQYFKELNFPDGHTDETIVGFVYGETKTHPIRTHNAVYILNENGQTFQRVYGFYNKY